MFKVRRDHFQTMSRAEPVSSRSHAMPESFAPGLFIRQDRTPVRLNPTGWGHPSGPLGSVINQLGRFMSEGQSERRRRPGPDELLINYNLSLRQIRRPSHNGCAATCALERLPKSSRLSHTSRLSQASHMSQMSRVLHSLQCCRDGRDTDSRHSQV